MNRPESPEELEAALRLLNRLLGARRAWFLREGRDARALELRAGEWELCAARGALVLSYWGESGARAWRVAGWRAAGESLLLEARGRVGRALLCLVPRALVASARATLAEARRAECERLAAILSGLARTRP
ncbi:MAG TPA: hypothetical protein VF508_00125, partial [Pyrinomonadaceae bacterium]